VYQQRKSDSKQTWWSCQEKLTVCCGPVLRVLGALADIWPHGHHFLHHLPSTPSYILPPLSLLIPVLLVLVPGIFLLVSYTVTHSGFFSLKKAHFFNLFLNLENSKTVSWWWKAVLVYLVAVVLLGPPRISPHCQKWRWSRLRQVHIQWKLS